MIADLAKVQCKTKEAMETITKTKKCMTDGIYELKEVIEKIDDQEVCKKKTKNIFVRNVGAKGAPDMKIVECMDKDRQFMQKNDPFEKCTGIV